MRSDSFQDHFSRDSASYAKFRPGYPTALFAWLADLAPARRLAWDCATGNGQAALGLAAHFRYVIGSDASRRQLGAAVRSDQVGYLAALGEASALATGRVDLIAVAQAFHWLDLPRFYEEVDRVANPSGAVLAVWGYGLLRAEPEIEGLIHRFHRVTLGRFWPAERKLVDEGYRSFVIPIREVPAPAFSIEADLDLMGLLGYLRTWSAVGKYLEARGTDPVSALEPQLLAAWGDPRTPRPIRWPLFVRAGPWRRSSGASPPARS